MNHNHAIRILTEFALVIGPSPAHAEEIHETIEKGRLDQVKALLTANPELKQSRDKMRLTPLHAAVSAGKVEVVEYLLGLGADVNARAYNDFTPLHFAEDPRIIKLLAAHQADLEAISAGGTPLQHAAHRLLDDDRSDYAKKGRAMARALIVAGAKYDILSAARLNDLDRVKQIVKADPLAVQDKRAMRDAARNGHVGIVQFLLDRKGDPDDAAFGGLPVLYFALKHPDVVKALIRAGADIKTPFRDKRAFGTGHFPEGRTVLHEAARVGVTESARLVIEAGAEVDARDPRGFTPLHYAATDGWPEIVKLLRRNKASVQGDDGNMALRAAVGRVYHAEQKATEVERYRAVITFLISEGVPGNLRAAMVLGDTDGVKKLVKQDALQPDAAVSREKPVLHLAVGLNQTDVVAVLLDGGAPIDETDDSGYTALHDAAFWGRAEIAKLLIERGAKVDARTKGGASPLSEAARCGKLAVARVLLAAGASVNAEDNDGRTPLGNAERSDRAMIELLKMNGGR